MSRSKRARDLAGFGGALAGISFVGGVAAGVGLADSPYPRPGAAVADVQRYFRGNPIPARISAAGQLLSAASLAAFTGSVARLVGRSEGRGSGALRVAVLAGGALATASLVASAALGAALTGRPGASAASARHLHRLAFLAGGPVHGVGLGMLVGSLGLAGLRSGELSRPLSVAGMASAGAAVLSPASLAAEPTMVVIPLSRLSALAVSGIAGARLTHPNGNARSRG